MAILGKLRINNSIKQTQLIREIEQLEAANAGEHELGPKREELFKITKNIEGYTDTLTIKEQNPGWSDKDCLDFYNDSVRDDVTMDWQSGNPRVNQQTLDDVSFTRSSFLPEYLKIWNKVSFIFRSSRPSSPEPASPGPSVSASEPGPASGPNPSVVAGSDPATASSSAPVSSTPTIDFTDQVEQEYNPITDAIESGDA